MIAYRQNYAALRHQPTPPAARPAPCRRVIARQGRPVEVASSADHLLIEQIRGLSILTGITTSRIGRDALGDPRLYRDLLLGRTLTDRTRQKLRAYLAQSLRTAAVKTMEASHA